MAVFPRGKHVPVVSHHLQALSIRHSVQVDLSAHESEHSVVISANKNLKS